ncbi:hypothetical protein O9993_01295 [Vibrio lentus]|nr:hypothetical protein [Vibrio lentus]
MGADDLTLVGLLFASFQLQVQGSLSALGAFSSLVCFSFGFIFSWLVVFPIV